MKGLRWVEKQISSKKKEIDELKEYMDDLNQGKTTFKKIWMAVTFRSMTTQECMRKIFDLENQVDGWEHVLEYVTFYIPMIVFPRFKRDRGAQYFQFLTSFAEAKTSGDEHNIYIWNKVAFYSRSVKEQSIKITDQIKEEIEEEERSYLLGRESNRITPKGTGGDRSITQMIMEGVEEPMKNIELDDGNGQTQTALIDKNLDDDQKGEAGKDKDDGDEDDLFEKPQTIVQKDGELDDDNDQNVDKDGSDGQEQLFKKSVNKDEEN